MVVSVPDTDRPIQFVYGIGSLDSTVRWLVMADPATGEVSDSRLVLNNARQVLVHEVTVELQSYTNISNETIDVDWLRQPMSVEPGSSISYTGIQRPADFHDDLWDHRSEPVQVDPRPDELA